MAAEAAPARRTPENIHLAIAAPPAAGSPRHAAWLYAPTGRRDAIAALLALEREIAASAAASLAHEVAHVRLAWWHEETTALTAGHPRHPLTRYLQADALRRDQPPPDLRPWVLSVGQQLAKVAWATRDELRTHLQLWVDALWMNLLRLNAADGCADSVNTVSLRETGFALRELELLANLADSARGGCLYLPFAELQRSGTSTADCYAQPWNDRLCGTIADRIEFCQRRVAASGASWPIGLLYGGRALAAWLALAQRVANRTKTALPMQYHADALSFRAAAGDTFAAWFAARRAQQRAAALPPAS